LLPGKGTNPLKLASAPVLIPLHAELLFVAVRVTVAVLVVDPREFVAVSV
jgi:hypothetical protein